MDNDLKDILSNSNKDIDNQKLMDYLMNQLSKKDSHDLEQDMAADEFLNDAVEGLQKLNNKKDVQAYVDQLNIDLQKQTAKNKKRKEKRKLKDQPFLYISIIIILLLVVISFFVIRKRIHARKNADSSAITLVAPPTNK
ncbi:MAG: hypothetical protein V4725_09130 [Bacteroidota bacterium]